MESMSTGYCPWLALVFGDRRADVDKELVIDFVNQLLNELDGKKFFLARTPLRNINFFTDKLELFKVIKDCIKETGDDQLILLFLIDNEFVSDTHIDHDIQNHFSNNVIIFHVTAGNVICSKQPGDRFIRDACSDFLRQCPDYVIEGLTCNGSIDNSSHIEQASSTVEDSSHIERPNSTAEVSSSIDRPNSSIEVAGSPTVLLSSDTLIIASNYLKKYPSNNDAVTYLCTEDTFNRLRQPFQLFEDNMTFLDVLSRSISTCSTTMNVLSHRDKVVMQLLDERFLSRLCSKYASYLCDSDALYENRGNIFILLRYLMENLSAIAYVVTSAKKNLMSDDWTMFRKLWQYLESQAFFTEEYLDPVSLNQLDTEIDALINFFNGSQLPKIPICSNVKNSYIKPQNSIHDQGAEHFWVRSEKRHPPEDFRTFSAIPHLSDLKIEKDHYIRRALISEPYKDSNHYLDILFRLVREDLVSPLRDGIALHKVSGLSLQKKMDSNGLMNDLAVYEVKNMGGAQVDFRHGHTFRYCELAFHSQGKWSEKVASYGQLLSLSLDGFEEDIHFAIVVECIEGRVGLMFPVESGIQKGKTYTVAEPKSYLEAYRYVLDSIKNLSRFRPIPFERYIVHGREDVRQPLYMRVQKSQSEADEEAAFEAYYTVIRMEEKARRLSIEEVPESKINKLRKSRRKSKTPVISELDEPLFPTRPNPANTAALQRISIGGVAYNVADLENKFLPDGMDESQRLALIGALTRELTIIQGPPGTGKTFLGVKIVNTLFENRDRFNNLRPILLVCYTNTAVDQFLERVHRELSSTSFFDHWRDVPSQENYVLPTIVRIGSKCSSEVLLREGRQINDVVQFHKSTLAQEEDSICGSLMSEKRVLAKKIAECAVLIRSTRRLFSYESLQSVIPEKFRIELTAIAYRYLDSFGKQMNVDEALACWLLDRTFGNDVNPTLSKTSLNKNPDILKEQIEQFSDSDDDEEILNKLFERLNAEDSSKVFDNADITDEEKYFETSEPWDILMQVSGSSHRCILFGTPTKRQRDQSIVSLDKNIVEAIEQIEEEVIKVPSLSDDEMADIRTIQSLTRPKRWQVYATWIRDLKRELRSTLPAHIEMFKKVAQDQLNARINLQAAVLKDSLIIGATTTGAAKNRKLLEQIGCRILVVEEAAEILEAHTFSCMLPSVEHAILIGDHQQLRPLPSVPALAREYRLDISMFERLVKLRLPYYTLEKQHRMNADITKIIVRPHFYESIRDHESVLDYSPVQGLKKRLFFWTHSQKEELPFPGALSFHNKHEARMALSLADYILQQGVYLKKDITIIAMYGSQVELLRRESIERFGTVYGSDNVPEVAVETVDSFQGQENKIVIVSLVRSFGPGIGFLSTPNRICVALTRAKHGLYILGNIEHLSQYSNMWREIYSSLFADDSVSYRLPIQCKTHGTCQEICDPSDFSEMSPNGGCAEPCGERLACGHVCPSQCHAVEYHNTLPCRNPCEKKCDRGHKCSKTCSESCGNCETTIQQKLECRHSVDVSCYKADVAVCESTCDKPLACGHKCSERCSQSCTTQCKKLVSVSLPCNHVVNTPCYTKSTTTCDYPCKEVLPECGHRCQELCSAPCTLSCKEIITMKLAVCGHVQSFTCSDSERKCAEPVIRKFDRCGHTGKLKCYIGDDSSHCQSTCNEKLPCGHICQDRCGQCYMDGAHCCRMNCSSKLPCGHQCGSRCGADCKCVSSCVSSCKHLSCGGDSTKKLVFNRQCSQPCVLCWKSCDNFCQHRSCTLKCFEECEVDFCNEPCSKKLRCGHACLGVCGETCPDLCGLCNRADYNRVLTLLDKDVSLRRIHRVIQLSNCRHMFPIEYLDEVFLKFQKDYIWPCCPGIDGVVCGQPISSSFRYSKITKSLTLYYSKKNERLIDNVLYSDKSRLITKVTSSLSSLNRFSSRRGAFYTRAALFTKTILTVLPSFQQADNDYMVFWHHYLGCISASVNLLVIYFDSSIPKRMRDPQGLNDLYLSVFERESSQAVIENSLDDLAEWLNQSSDQLFVGYCMPRARFLFYRASFFITIGYMSGLVKSSNTDLTTPQSVELQSIAKAFLSCNEGDDYHRHYTSLFELIPRMFGNTESIMKQWRPFKMLEVENF